MLDQINTYMDDLEDRNDSLNGKLHELMESNRQARLDFRAQLQGSETQEEEPCPADGDSSTTSKEDLNEDNDGDCKWVMRGGPGWKYLWKLTQTPNLCLLDQWPWSDSSLNLHPHQQMCDILLLLHHGTQFSFSSLLNCGVLMFGSWADWSLWT